MISSSEGDAGFSYGWINRELITSGKTLPHMNAFGGEDRFWMGTEGGQFSVFFAKGATFEFANWCTPAVLDTLPFKVISTSGDHAVFGARFALTNYSGTRFEIEVRRNVRVSRMSIAPFILAGRNPSWTEWLARPSACRWMK